MIDRCETEPATQVDPGDNLPHAPHGAVDIGQHRPLHLDRVVVTRAHVGWRIVVIDDIDPAHESNTAINQRQLAMQPPQAVPLQAEAPQLRPVNEGPHPSRGKAGLKINRKITRAKTIDRHIHHHAARSSSAQRRTDRLAHRIGSEDIGLQIDFPLCSGNGCQQGRKVLAPGIEQSEAVTGQELRFHSGLGTRKAQRDRKFLPRPRPDE